MPTSFADTLFTLALIAWLNLVSISLQIMAVGAPLPVNFDSFAASSAFSLVF